MKLMPDKFKPFHIQASHVGCLVSNHQPRRLVGRFLTYYSSHIEDFSRITNPVYELLNIQPGILSAQSPQAKTKVSQPSSKTHVERTIDDQEALELLLRRITKPSTFA